MQKVWARPKGQWILLRCSLCYCRTTSAITIVPLDHLICSSVHFHYTVKLICWLNLVWIGNPCLLMSKKKKRKLLFVEALHSQIIQFVIMAEISTILGFSLDGHSSAAGFCWHNLGKLFLRSPTLYILPFYGPKMMHALSTRTERKLESSQIMSC